MKKKKKKKIGGKEIEKEKSGEDQEERDVV